MMASSASPIDIATPSRINPSSPRNQTSNLTHALQEAGATAPPPDAFNEQRRRQDDGRLSVTGRHDSMSNTFGSSYYGSGARPISVKERQRRESNTGSFIGGMSWGGISVGSWVRDDVIMAGTSPNTFHQSPSFHSSSYLPKMEANFLRDYSCCGQQLDSLHELLQHFEENHAQQSSQIVNRPSGSGQGGRRPSTGLGQGESAKSFQGFDPQRQQQVPRSSGAPLSRGLNSTDGFNRTQLTTVQDMDALEDMEMDDAVTPGGTMSRPQPQYGGNSANILPLNTNMANTMTAQQAFRSSAPPTPATPQPFAMFSNPTVSSVNTPALSTQSLQHGQRTSPESSIPGTPAELDPNFMMGNYMGGMPMGNNGQMMQDNFDFGGTQFGLSNNFNDMTIDEPAKRLLSKQGGMTNQQLAFALKSGQIPLDSELGKRLREQQAIGGAGSGVMFPDQEIKPFRCPVIGCEKAYKNQNGLKYHKAHGHQNQKLQENEDGTFSIVDPLTSAPYPGTQGMEKEKPYRCEVCGKRYKNLNGLKYHRAHSPQCNPELKLNALGISGNMQALNPNANVAGAGLHGMGDSNIF